MKHILEFDFDEYLSLLDEEGVVIPELEGHAQSFLRMVTKAVNDLIGDVDTIAHKGLNLDGGGFSAEINIEEPGTLAQIKIMRSGIEVATFLVETSLTIELTKEFGMVLIETK